MKRVNSFLTLAFFPFSKQIGAELAPEGIVEEIADMKAVVVASTNCWLPIWFGWMDIARLLTCASPHWSYSTEMMMIIAQSIDEKCINVFAQMA